MKIVCPNCKMEYTLKDSVTETRFKCAKCRAIFQSFQCSTLINDNNNGSLAHMIPKNDQQSKEMKSLSHKTLVIVLISGMVISLLLVGVYFINKSISELHEVQAELTKSADEYRSKQQKVVKLQPEMRLFISQVSPILTGFKRLTNISYEKIDIGEFQGELYELTVMANIVRMIPDDEDATRLMVNLKETTPRNLYKAISRVIKSQEPLADKLNDSNVMAPFKDDAKKIDNLVQKTNKLFFDVARHDFEDAVKIYEKLCEKYGIGEANGDY